VVVTVVLVGVIVVLALAALFLVGTTRGDDGSAPSPATNDGKGRPSLKRPTVPDGYELFEDTDGSFALVVPDGWETILLDDASVHRAQARLEDENPRLAAALDVTVKAVGGGGLGFAAEPADTDGFVANMNLLLAPRSNESLADVAVAGKARLEASGVTVGQPVAVTVGDRPALIVDYTAPTPAGPASVEQLYVASGYRVYILTVSGASPTTTHTIVKSLRVP
jgi:hypothetical protein